MIPRPVVSFTPPSRPEDMVRREHNRIVKQVVREVMSEHWQRHTRSHFQMGARHKYSYSKRSPKYLKAKRKKYGHTIDMLASGKTRAEMAGRKPHIAVGGGGVTSGKAIGGSYKLRFPFNAALQANFVKRLNRLAKYGYKAAAARLAAVTKARRNVVPQLRREMERWSGDEVAWAIREFESRYMAKVNAFRGRRKRRRSSR